MTNKIIEAISIALNNKYGDKYEYYRDDVTQGLSEPCFFIRLVESAYDKASIGHHRKTHTFDVHYFPTDGGKNSEMFDVADDLLDVLRVVTAIDGHKFRGTGMNYNVVDNVLHFFVDYISYPMDERADSGDYMEELDQTITDKEGGNA